MTSNIDTIPTCEADTELRFGLSHDDVEALKKERVDMVEELIKTPQGRAMIRNACPDLDLYGRTLNESVHELGDIAQKGDDPVRARAASIMLNDLMQTSHREATHDLYTHRSKHYRWAQDAHRWMDRKIRANTANRSSRRRQLIAQRWGWNSMVLTVLAALMLGVFSSFAWAAVFIGLRILVTAVIWSLASFPADDSPNKPVLDSDPRMCVIGHGGDLIIFTTFALSIARHDHINMAFLVITAGCVTIFGTIFRIAASASGYPIPRLHLERMIRAGSMFTALVLAAFHSIPWWWSAVALMALPSLFAWIEVREAWRALRLKVDDPFEPITPSCSVDTTADVDQVSRAVQ